ncbi:MAG: MopE-related protein, partial [Flavobacterium sp.]|uniref:MopE-related protein n=1 Tax=Flavobacterium sp. TaxID=239 RepID=UPI003BA4BFFA
MKKILLLFFLMTISLGYSQALLLGFETTETGGVSGGPFGGMPVPVLETGTGTNTSRVLRIDGNTAGEPWQGINLNLTNSVNLTVNKTLTMDVLSSTPVTFLVKVTTGGAIAAAPVTHNGDGTWQTLSFTFNTSLDNQVANPSGTYSGFVIHAYWEVGRTQFFTPTVTPRPVRTFFVDNIRDPSSLPFPNLGPLTVASPQVIGSAPFTITNPTSDSSGAWTYTSNPSGVVTFSGNTATIVGVGTTTITATQAAVPGQFAAGTRTATLTVTPTAAPNPPARNPWDVISFYSGAYTTFSSPTWGGTSNNDVLIEGNTTRIFNSGYTNGQIAFAATNLSQMTHVHVDVYSVNLTPIWLFLGSKRITVNTPVGGWTSLDIPLTDFTSSPTGAAINLSSINLFRTENPVGAAAPPRIIYLDNIYFYRSATDTPPTIGSLTLPSPQVLGNSPFTITNPTSNSGGAWSYSASPSGIVNISGNTVTIVGVGTATITATQAAVPGSFGPAITSAQLVVNFPAPTVAAPTPTVPAGNVISIYSNAYTPVAGVTLNPNWGQQGFGTANVSSFTVAGNNTLFYPNFNYQGNQFSVQNLSTFNSMHLDIWTPNMNFLRISLIRSAGGGERPVTIPVTPNTWNSVDILLSQWSSQSGFSLANIAEIKYEFVSSLTAPSWSPGGVLYLDNIYFSNVVEPINPIVSNFSIPTKAPGDATFTITPPTSNSPGAWSYSSSNDAVGTIVNGNQIQVGVGGSATITATQAATANYNSATITATFNVLVTPTLGTFTVDPKVTGDAPFALTAPTSNSAGAFTYTILPAGIASISGNTVTILAPGTATITATQAANGLFASATTTASLVVSLGTAAPQPPVRNPWDVISFYSEAYTNTSPPNWAQGSDVSIGGNTTRLLSNYTLGSLNFASVNVSTMTTLHIDIYSVNQNPTWIRINGIQQFVATTPVNGWTSLDIPLSSFAGANLNSVSSIVVFNPSGAELPLKTAYVDNVYFYRPATDQPPTIGSLTVPSPQVVGNAPFTLTNPTSNSTGAWTYSASPAGIVTFVGNTATIVGAGTATITASQAAVPGVFGPGIATASLVVNFPEPGPSPIPPARDANRVISLYTGDQSIYTNVPNYNFGQAFWSTGGGRILTEVPNGTNTALRIDGLGFMGLIDIGNPPPTNRERRINLVGTGMSHLNIDIYLDAPRPNLFLVLLAPGDRLHNTGPLAAGWNTVRVPLTAYPGALNDIYGLKIEQNYAAPFRIFIDNVYFSNDLFTFYADSDGDGFGDLANSVLAETAPTGFVSNSTDCDDNNNSVWRIGDFYIDVDGDGYGLDAPLTTLCYGASFDPFLSLTSLGIDCDDSNASINPGATEICFDGIDQNCNGSSTDGCS